MKNYVRIAERFTTVQLTSAFSINLSIVQHICKASWSLSSDLLYVWQPKWLPLLVVEVGLVCLVCVSTSLLHGLSLWSQGTTAKWNEVKKSRSASQLSGGKKKAAAVAVPPSTGGNHSTAVTTLLRWAVSWGVWDRRRLLEMDWMDGVHLVQYDVCVDEWMHYMKHLIKCHVHV